MVRDGRCQQQIRKRRHRERRACQQAELPRRPKRGPRRPRLRQSRHAGEDAATGHHPRQGCLHHRRGGPRLHRRRRRYVVRQLRVQRERSRGCRDRAVPGAALLPLADRQDDRAHGPTRGAAQGVDPCADGQGLLRQLGLGGQRHAGQARLVLPQRHRQAGKEEDNLPLHGLPRRDLRRGQRHRHPADARGLRPARQRPLPQDRLPALLPLRRAWRERGGLRLEACQQSRRADRAGGARDRGGLLCRTRDGRWRLPRAAQDLLREGAGRPRQVRDPVLRRRGHHRLREDRQLAGVGDLQHQAGRPLAGQGTGQRLPADLGGDDQPEALRRHAC